MINLVMLYNTGIGMKISTNRAKGDVRGKKCELAVVTGILEGIIKSKDVK